MSVFLAVLQLVVPPGTSPFFFFLFLSLSLFFFPLCLYARVYEDLSRLTTHAVRAFPVSGGEEDLFIYERIRTNHVRPTNELERNIGVAGEGRGGLRGSSLTLFVKCYFTITIKGIRVVLRILYRF